MVQKRHSSSADCDIFDIGPLKMLQARPGCPNDCLQDCLHTWGRLANSGYMVERAPLTRMLEFE
jgi:hypothetical protein